MNKLLNKTTFITGSTKNSGKTTFLNRALGELRAFYARCPGKASDALSGGLAYMSIGVDGEAFDQIFGHKKPRVRAEAGDLVVTVEAALKATEAKFKVIRKFPFSTVLGRPVLVRIERPGLIEIVGPDNNAQLGKILKYVHENIGARTILVDGAINRVTQVTAIGEAQFVYTVKVERARLQSAAEEMKRIYELSRVGMSSPRKRGSHDCTGDSRFRGNDTLFIAGALTRAKADKIPGHIKNVVVEDFTKVFLTYKELVNFQKRHKLFYGTGFRLVLIVANLFDIAKKEFTPLVGRLVPKKMIIYNVIPTV